ncbi:hypothetical protein A2U01_0073260, partial [Trifolium medium]|nr:hypothetical protein [Trifolium medium]
MLPETHKGGEAHIVTLKTKATNLDDRLDGTVKGGPGPMEDVQVGDIVVKLRASKESVERAK